MEKFLTVEQVSDLLQVHLDTVRFWLRTGKLPGVKVGRAWRIPEGALQTLSQDARAHSQPSSKTASL